MGSRCRASDARAPSSVRDDPTLACRRLALARFGARPHFSVSPHVLRRRGFVLAIVLTHAHVLRPLFATICDRERNCE